MKKKMTESQATERFMAKHGPVTTIRLIGYAYKLEVAGEDWLREKVSRQQLLHIRKQFSEAGVPWGEGAIEWSRLLTGLKTTHEDAKARQAARAARRSPRTA